MNIIVNLKQGFSILQSFFVQDLQRRIDNYLLYDNKKWVLKKWWYIKSTLHEMTLSFLKKSLKICWLIVLINVQGHNTDFRDKHILYKQVYLSRYKNIWSEFFKLQFYLFWKPLSLNPNRSWNVINMSVGFK